MAIDLAAQAEHGEGTIVCAVSDDPALLDAIDFDPGDAAAALVDAPDLEAALAFAEAFAPEHLELVGADAEALAPRVRSAGCLFVGREGATAFGDYVAGSNHTLPTGGAARFASGLNVGHFRRRMSEVRIGAAAGALAARRRADRARRGLRAPRGLDGGAGESRTVTRTAEISRDTKETRIALSLALDGSGAGTRATGVGFLDHMLDLLARHGRLDLDVEAQRRPRDRRTPHRRGHRHRLRPGARHRRWATAPGSRATAAPRSRWTRRAPSCAIDISGRPYCHFEADLPPGGTGGFDHELAEEFFRAVANAARLTVHVDVETGTNAHHMIEAAFKAFARALRAAVALDPTETGRPVDQGDAHVVTTIGLSTTAWATAAASRRRSSASAPASR